MAKTVFITGASSGIGKASAKLFLEKGWNVIATMRTPKKDEGWMESGQLLVLQMDVRYTTSISKALAEGISKFGSVDVLINNAGYALIGIFESASLEQIRQQYETNVFGLMAVVQAFLPHFRSRKSGVIVNLSSYGGLVALPIGSLYNSSKFAVEGFSEGLSHELAGLNILVKVIEPGAIATNFRNNIDLIKCDIPDYEKLTAGFFEKHGKLTADRKKASVAEVAETIYQSATDGTRKLRYVAGADAQFFIDRKYKQDETAYLEEMTEYFNPL